ncbi:hypothetical protein BGX21_011088 [Mortierella sp. AD011]|nr:hypothetical protein BGX20_008792 [Mortierella sp. AD010]KAF9402148.1 hypothetical protein BGX21_011088 [Mortierella sp. AD011]
MPKQTRQSRGISARELRIEKALPKVLKIPKSRRSIVRPMVAAPATRGAPNRDDVEDEDENNGNSDGDNEEEEATGEDEVDNWDIPVWRYLILLAHLRKVILQNAATLMAEGENDPQCPYGERHPTIK